MIVGSAFVAIKPDTSKFRPQLVRELRPLIAAAEKQLKGIEVKVRADTGQASRTLATLSRKARDLDGSSVNLDVGVKGAGGGDRLDDFDRSTRSASGGAKSLETSLAQLAGGFGALAVAQGLLKTPTMIEGLTAAIGVTTALGGASIALVSALAPVAGLLPVVAAGGLAVGQGVAVAAGAFVGIGGALKAYKQAQDTATVASVSGTNAAKASARAQRAAATQLRSAISDVGEARRASAEAVVAASARVDDAERDLIRSQESARRAQDALNQARRDAKEELEDLHLAVERSALGEERAQLRLQEARRRLARVRVLDATSGGRASSELADATLDVRDAELSLRESAERRGDEQERLNRLTRDGIDGSEQVVAAQDALREANERVADSRRSLLGAEAAVTTAQEQGARRVEAALTSVERAQEAVADAAERANEATASAAGGVDKFAAAMSDLSPAAQSFVRTLIDLKPKLKDLRDTAAEGFFPGAERGLRRLSDTLFPSVRTAVGDTSKTLGELADEGGKVLGSPFFAGRFATIASRNDTILRSLGSAALGLAEPLTRVVDSAGPMAARFALAAERGAGLLSNFIRTKEESGALDRSFLTVERTLRTVGRTGANVGRSLTTVFREAFPAGQQYLAMLDGAAARMASLTRSGAESGSLRRFFDSTIPVTRELGGLVGDLVKGLGGIGRGVMPELAPLVALVRSDLTPAVLNLVSSLDMEFLTALVRLAATGADFLSTFATATPILTGAADGLNGVLRVAVFLGNELGPLSPLLVNAAASMSLLGAASATLKIGRMISDFAGARAGLTLFSGAATVATGTTGRLAGAMGLLRAAMGPLVIAATIGYTLKRTFDQIAPSVDKTVAALSKGPHTAEAFYSKLNKLNRPNLFDQWKTNVRNILDVGPIEAWSRRMDNMKVTAEDTFRKMAIADAEAAVSTRNSMERRGQSTAAFDRILDELGISQRGAAAAADALTASIDRQTDQFLEASGIEVAYQEAIDRLSDSLARNGQTFDANTAQGRENIRARDELFASTGRMVAQLVNEANQSGITAEAQRGVLNRLYELRDSGYPGAREQADAYIRKVEAIPRDKTTKINVETREAHQAIKSIVAAFDGIDGRVARLAVEVFGVDEAKSSLSAIRRDFGDITKSFPGREHGGPVRRGVPYVVGEKRRELFVPDEDGYVLPRVPGRGGDGAAATAVAAAPTVTHNHTWNLNGIREGDLPTEIPRRIRDKQHLWG